MLPQWDFVASVESESFAGEGSVHWPGSPLEFDLATLSGNASLDLVKGVSWTLSRVQARPAS